MEARPERSKLKEYLEKKTDIKGYKLRPAPGNGDKIQPLGEGGSAVVYLVDQVLHEDTTVPRAMKFFYYKDDIAALTVHETTGPVSERDFLAEVANLANVSHQNLVRVIDAGVQAFNGLKVPYLVSHYVSGSTLRELIKEASEHIENQPWLADLRKQLVDSPSSVFDFILQLASAVSYLHRSGLAHCDIAPKNIFIDTCAGISPILGDLGIAKSVGPNVTGEVFLAGSKNYVPENVAKCINTRVSADRLRQLHPAWDIYGFAKSVRELVHSLHEHKASPWWSPLIDCLDAAMDGRKYKTIDELIERIEFLRPVHRELASVEELSGAITGKARKLMPVAQLLLTKRIRKITEHPALLRLSKVPQLTVAENVFPGAMHTRYEHALGTMETTRRYLLALLDQPEFLGHLSADRIELCLLCGLFWNITRFPFSNVIHEIKDRNKARFGNFGRSSLLSDIFEIKDRNGETIVDLVKRHFPRVSIDALKRILLGNHDGFNEEDQLIYSLFNSSLDTRVLDFVRRDSLHLGITHGETLSLDELLPHLTIYAHRLALKSRGVTVAEEVISLRYWLFNRIYWSRPNRGYVTMLRYLLLELSESDPDFLRQLRAMVVLGSAEDVLENIVKAALNCPDAGARDIALLLHGIEHRLYVPAFDISPRDNPELANAFRTVARMDHSDLKTLGRELREILKPHLASPSGDHHVLVDVPDEPGETKLGEDVLVITETGAVTNLKDFSGIVRGINDSFEHSLRRLRVFVHPEAYPKSPDDRKSIHEGIHSHILRKLH